MTSSILVRSGLSNAWKDCSGIGSSFPFQLSHHDLRWNDAYRCAVAYAAKGRLTLDETVVKTIHERLVYGGGCYRRHDVRMVIGGRMFPPWSTVPEMMDRFFLRAGSLLSSAPPVDAAAVIHQEFVSIHPFPDGNGRVARLLMDSILLHFGYYALDVDGWKCEYNDALCAYQDDGGDAFLDLVRKKVEESEAMHHGSPKNQLCVPPCDERM